MNGFKKINFFLHFHKSLLHLQSQTATRGHLGRHFPQQGGREGEIILRYGVMVALQILALSVRVRVLLSQQSKDERLATGLIPQISDGGIAQLVRAHDS